MSAKLLEKGRHAFVGVLKERRGSQFSLLESEDCLEVWFMGLVAGGNYILCLVIVVTFMEFGGAKKWGSLKSS